MISKNSKIYIAGHNGMVGSACWRLLKFKGYNNLIGKTRHELDLTNQEKVASFFRKEKPEIVIDSAAKVGGILANKNQPYNFLIENLQIQNNLIQESLICGVKKFIFLGSSCIYPRNSPQPIKESYLLTDSLESTNQWYAIAKISGVKLIEATRAQFKKDFISLMPTNLYGPNDNYDSETSHVLPALIKKIHDARVNGLKQIKLWGSGKPLREFLHVDDLAKAIVFVLENKLLESIYNIGSGEEISIKKLAFFIKDVIGYEGDILWDTSIPDGTPRKLLDSSKISNLGFKTSISLNEGVKDTYKKYCL